MGCLLMKPAVEILEEKLSKRWLSNKAVRDGMIACFIKTFQAYDQKMGRVRSEPQVNKAVHDVAEVVFAEIGVGFEVPTLEELKRIKGMMDERLGLRQIQVSNPGLYEEHERICEALFSKMDSSSEDSARQA